MKLYVRYKSVCTEDYHDGQEYGDWYKNYDFEVVGVSLSSMKNWGHLGHLEQEFEVDYDCDVGDKVYVLAMWYRSGDSFGHSDNNEEIIWVFKNETVANHAYAQWMIACDKQRERESFSVPLRIDNGTVVDFSNPAAGFFERLQDLQIIEFRVSA